MVFTRDENVNINVDVDIVTNKIKNTCNYFLGKITLFQKKVYEQKKMVASTYDVKLA